MRFERIDLKAYGHFTDKTLELSDSAKTVHVIFGPNEAGKSTLKDAIAELLFGFDVRNKYAFFHTDGSLSLAATIVNSAGARLSIVRKKKRRGNDLFDAADEQLPATALTPFVGGLTREAYESQFCLSRQSMIDGSSEIAHGTGEVGESLYNAALGNTSLPEIIARLEKQRDDLFTPTARNKPLNAAISAYEGQRAEARAVINRPDDWQRISSERDKLADDIADINRRIGEANVLVALLTSLRACYPNYDRLRGARAALLEAADESRMTLDAVNTAAAHLEGLAAVEHEIERCERRIARLVDEIGPEPDDSLIKYRAMIEGLKGRVETYRKGRADLQERDLRGHANRNAEAAQRYLDSVWPGLNITEARKRIVPADVQTRGNALVVEVLRLKVQCDMAAGTERDLVDQIAGVEGELEDLAHARDLTALRAAVAAVAADPRLDQNIAHADRDAGLAAKTAATALAALGRFGGSLADLAAATLPLPATIDRHANVVDALRGRAERNVERIEDERRKHAAAGEQLDAMARDREIVTLADLTAARDERDGRFDVLAERWRAGAPIPEINSAASDYQPTVVAADGLADTLRNEAERVTRVAALEAQRDAAGAELNRLADELTAMAAEREAAHRAWEAEWATLGVEPLPPAEMRGWITAATDVRVKATDADQKAAARDELIARRTGLRTALVDALASLGRPVPDGTTIEPVLAMARDVIAAADALEATRARLTTDKARHVRNLVKHRRDTTQAQDDLVGVTAEFRTILERLWLPLDLQPGVFADAVAAITGFHERDRSARHDASRADGIDRDNAAFHEDVLAFVRLYVPALLDLADASPDVAAEDLSERLLVAQTEFDKRAARLQQLEAERAALAAEIDKRDIIAADLAVIIKREGITRDLLPVRLERSRILNNHAQTVEAETAHIEAGMGLSLAECDAQYGDRDRATIENDLVIANAQIENLTGERNQLNPALWSINEKLRRMDGSNAAADAEATLAELGSKVDQQVRRWVEVALALHVLKEQIRQYAETNQGELITRASYYLNLLTGGAYAKLRAVNDGESNVLEAVRKGGDGLEISALSEGTRDQLFLALRLAALEKYLQEAEPQPLILDDTFVAFDDERTVRAFQALAEVAGQTQVLYFTHHAACVEAARIGVLAEQLAVYDLDDVGVPVASALVPT